MHYLIDGHNLIAKIPDISLSDPNDEVKLVMRLQSWAAGGRKRRVTVIFDGGLPGGKSLKFSNRLVSVRFASAGQTADALLIGRIRRAKNPAEFTLISSDQQIIAAAQARRMPVQRSEAFAAGLAESTGPGPRKRRRPTPDTADEPRLSKAEVAEWMELFGPEPERPALPRRPKRPRTNQPTQPKKPARRRPLTTSKNNDELLDPEDVDAWLDFFDRNR